MSYRLRAALVCSSLFFAGCIEMIERPVVEDGAIELDQGAEQPLHDGPAPIDLPLREAPGRDVAPADTTPLRDGSVDAAPRDDAPTDGGVEGGLDGGVSDSPAADQPSDAPAPDAALVDSVVDTAALEAPPPVDTSPPVLVDARVAPQQVDVTDAQALVDVALEVTDASDIALLTVTFALETNRQKTFHASFYPGDYNSATGAYEAQITIPQGQEPGTYRLVHAYLADVLGNYVTPSSTNPTLAGFDISTVSFDVLNGS